MKSGGKMEKLYNSIYNSLDRRDYTAARKYIEELAPHDFFTQFLHARILFMEKRYVSAYKELKDIQLPSDKVYGYGEKIANLMGQCCRILGRTGEAAQAYKKAAEWASEPALKAMEYSNYLFNLHYTAVPAAKMLTAAQHTIELGRTDGVTWLIDGAMGPIGTASCGPEPLEKDRLYLKEARSFRFAFLPFDAETLSAEAAAQAILS